MAKFEPAGENPFTVYLDYYPELDARGEWGCYQWSPVRTKFSVAKVIDGKGTTEYTEEEIKEWQSLTE
jgi:hypothetical protein